MSIVKILPELCLAGGTQMALDDGLLDTAESVIARRYTWVPPALSLGKFQAAPDVPEAATGEQPSSQAQAAAGLPFDVVRRPTGGRAVLHGEEFEWSFAVAFPPGALGARARAGLDVAKPYEIVAGAFAGALRDLDVDLDESGESSYQRSALCFSTVLRHDLLSRGEKLVAIAQARRGGRVLVHGSVLERRPPDELVVAVESLLRESWQGEGLAGAGLLLAPEMIWRRVLVRLEAVLRGLVPA